MSVCCPAVLLSLLNGLIVSCTRITCIQPLSFCSLTFPVSSFFSESVCLLLLSLFCFLSLLFHYTSFVFIFGLLASSYPLMLACLIRAAILNFSFRLHLRFAMSSVAISDLLHQSAGIVFLDGGRVSLAFHLFVVGTVIQFCFCALMSSQVKNFKSLFLQRKMWCRT